MELGPNGAFVTRKVNGEYEYPEDRATLTADWDHDKWGVFAAVSYIGSFQDLPDANFDTVPDYNENDTRDVGSFTTVGLQGRFNLNGAGEVPGERRQRARRGAAVRGR